MTLAQLDALMRVENKRQAAANGQRNGAGSLPSPDARTWGTANDLASLERRLSG